MIQAIVSTLYWIVLALTLLGAILAKLLCDRLERHHPVTWKALGEPSLFMGASIRAQHKTSKFLWSRAYEELGDERLNRIGTAARVFAMVTLLLIFLGCMGFAYLRA